MITRPSTGASRPRRSDDIMGCVNDLGDVVPVLLDVEVHPDPPSSAHIGWPEEPHGIECEPVLLGTIRSGRPERDPVVVVPVGERDELLAHEPGRLAVADPLGRAGEGQAQVAKPMHTLIGSRDRHPRNGTSAPWAPRAWFNAAAPARVNPAQPAWFNAAPPARVNPAPPAWFNAAPPGPTGPGGSSSERRYRERCMRPCCSRSVNGPGARPSDG